MEETKREMIGKKAAGIHKCVYIRVNCVANDLDDIRCGGPQYLGFDFPVKEIDKEEMRKFIIMTLQTLGVPLLRVYFSESFEMLKFQIWTKEKILTSITNDSYFLINESKSNYESALRR